MLDVDATLVTAHTQKKGAAATFRAASATTRSGCRATASERLAATLCPGKADSNTIADHIEVLTAAIKQILWSTAAKPWSAPTVAGDRHQVTSSVSSYLATRVGAEDRLLPLTGVFAA